MPRLHRRRFLRTTLAIPALSALVGCGLIAPQRPSTPRRRRIGYLAEGNRAEGSLDRINVAAYRAFQDSLGELGYVDGENVELLLRHADQARPADIEALAVELAGQEPDLLVASGTRPLVAIAGATGTIPVVFVYVGAPVETGLVRSLARPGGNVTGLTSFSPELAAKRLELLKETAPGVAQPGVVWNASAADDAQELAAAQAAAARLGLPLRSVEVRSREQLLPAIEAATREGVDALVVLGAGFSHTPVAIMAQRTRLPAVGRRWEFATNGGLLAYGPNYHAMHRRAATYVDKILKGAKPADLPVEQPTTFELVVNLKTAQALELTIPPSILVQATELIQ